MSVYKVEWLDHKVQDPYGFPSVTKLGAQQCVCMKPKKGSIFEASVPQILDFMDNHYLEAHG